MHWMLDCVYAIVALLISPIWLLRRARAGKLGTDWASRFGRGESLSPCDPNKTRILIHAVSVGEVNAIRTLVDALMRDREDVEVVIASTTDTGFARARSIFLDHAAVVRYPFDFSFAVNRLLDRVKPDLVLLVELEVWPNFTSRCAARGIPICVINGRLSERSFAWYRLVRPLVRPSFARLTWAAVQNEAYAARFRALGTKDVRVVGTMKWDTALIEDEVAGSVALAASMGIDRAKPLVVAGSTAPGEPELLVKSLPQGVQLLCAPRKPEWFDEAAQAMPGCARRSRNEKGTRYFLLDTIGELRQAYALADVVVIGRSFGVLHGSDMIEPIALGKATIIGPRFGDFQEAAEALISGGGLIQTTADKLPTALAELLEFPMKRAELAARGRAVIRSMQGATQRHLALLQPLLPMR
ncbi:MAG TPA: glycosyltransferase N-terminal domain-containing protein [Phycisphaerales bacterium]|nr:glycosyltransferase N-terminal domain-containing protein [Phycisphaerales bacterium]HRQ75117.1 glycosyltransferase N-terminal domain-containing protein [Phycisphaerales bacterium]